MADDVGRKKGYNHEKVGARMASLQSWRITMLFVIVGWDVRNGTARKYLGR